MPETMKLLESITIKVNKDENCENDLHLKLIEVVLVHCNIVDNDYQHDLRVLYTFFPNMSFGQFLNISHNIFLFLRTFNSKFSNIEISTDQNSILL